MSNLANFLTGAPEVARPAVQLMLQRSMSTKYVIGCVNLNAVMGCSRYSHFTSPIRRYVYSNSANLKTHVNFFLNVVSLI